MSNNEAIHKLRKNHQTVMLEKENANKNPFLQFEVWLEEALAAGFVEPNAVNLATISSKGNVTSRMVLLKAFDKAGFVFFTNYKSQKAQDLLSTRQAALTFWWDQLYRQVRICGEAEIISREASVEYFRTRPRGSQLGAAASQQSCIIENYAVLEAEFKRLDQDYHDQEIPCPEYWGGYRVIPDSFEFWQGRPNRLHDRLRYTKISTDDWKIDRLSP